MDIVLHLDNCSIKIQDKIISQIVSYNQINLIDREAGGILIARQNIENNNIIVEHSTAPMEGDQRFRNKFVRKDAGHIDYFNKLYHENAEIYCYLGEWHTHPEPIPEPSGIDIKNWTRIAQENQMEKSKTYFHIISGTSKFGIWQFSNHNIKKVYLDEVIR